MAFSGRVAGIFAYNAVFSAQDENAGNRYRSLFIIG